MYVMLKSRVLFLPMISLFLVLQRGIIQTIALYGLGDQEGYDEYYLDAMGMIADEFESRGATVVGEWPNDETYSFVASKALRNNGDVFVGLALDEDCQEELTEGRLSKWLAQVLPVLTAE